MQLKGEYTVFTIKKVTLFIITNNNEEYVACVLVPPLLNCLPENGLSLPACWSNMPSFNSTKCTKLLNSSDGTAARCLMQACLEERVHSSSARPVLYRALMLLVVIAGVFFL